MPRVSVTIPVPLHARPAALISHRARGLPVPVTVEHAGKQAPAASIFALIALEAEAGAELTLSAPDSSGGAEAVAILAELMRALR